MWRRHIYKYVGDVIEELTYTVSGEKTPTPLKQNAVKCTVGLYNTIQ